ncbi:MAG: hypothetical protein R8P61_17950 [Bacteroidia bacterium]|nr:hypothetical protein [Bacteroidia bacterium]
MRNTIILLLLSSHLFISCENYFEDKYVSQKEIYAYLEQASKTKPSQNHPSPFREIDFDKVIAYDFEGNYEPYPAVYNNSSQNFVPVVLRQKVLTQKQLDQMLNFLTKPETYGKGTAACFDPRMAIVFFKGDKVICQINICLDCNYLTSTIEIPASSEKMIQIDEDFEYPAKGFSTSGIASIIELAKELNMEYASYFKGEPIE